MRLSTSPSASKAHPNPLHPGAALTRRTRRRSSRHSGPRPRRAGEAKCGCAARWARAGLWPWEPGSGGHCGARPLGLDRGGACPAACLVGTSPGGLGVWGPGGLGAWGPDLDAGK